ncbi:response regulator [Pseudanabaena sp. ABRG5-3]|uniref:ATP-binding response regulator n=1 Tax=Pseudanabaena sp. ABRG5-3 TaxID=685565 RepID=UPI000DC6E248|nr:response regulator [Pseudanabaena sp. ABRG5-3]BBC25768.1 signal transduction histidine kinase [Pseudanabaena sp. ABRG5-3]
MTYSMIEIGLQQIKQTFSEEAQVYTNELANQVSKLDASSPNFSQQIDQLLDTHKLLKDAAIKADFYIQDSNFVIITNRLEKVINLLRDRPAHVDQLTKDLLFELIKIICQIINEYCFDSDPDPNCIELQNQVFTQIDEHFYLKNYGIEALINYSQTDQANDPFHLDDTSEALHLFDIEDFEFTNSDDLLAVNQLEQLDDSDTFFMLQLDDQQLEDSELTQDHNNFLNLDQNLSQSSNEQTVFPSLLTEIFTEDFDHQLDQHIQPSHHEEKLPMPELLKDIFPLVSTEQLLGHEDETSLQGIDWNHSEDDLDNPWHKLVSLQPWMEEDQDHDIEAQTLTNTSVGEPSTDQQNSENQNNSLDIDNVVLDNGIYNSYFDSLEFEPLEDDDEVLWDSIESMQLIDPIESIDELDLPEALTEPMPSLDNPHSQVYETATELITSLENSQPEENVNLLDMLENQGFSTSDVDTAIEESPIYQNKVKDVHAASHDRAFVNGNNQVNNHTDLNSDNSLHPILSAAIALNKNDLNLDLYTNLDLETEISKQSYDASLTPVDNDATIRIPLNHLEVWEDLSEELLVRKGSLDIYVGEMRLLLAEVQKNLQFLDPQAVIHNQGTVASLQSNLVSFTNILEQTEQQTNAMNHDVLNLRKSFRQALKYPISTLVRGFPRILRDLSLEHGKQVELIVQGAEIGIDRSLSGLVLETLEILIRNAFEHSIESPIERQQQGKLSQGQIEVVAIQTDDNTIIKVNDDGRGLDNLPNNTAYLEHISQLSEIRKRLWDRGGRISIQSQLGKGTQVTVTLPSMQSLLRILLIDIDQICLAISSKVIIEVIPIDDDDNFSKAEQETLLWRDRQIPIVRLDSLLQLNCPHNLHKSVNSQPSQFAGQIDSYKPAIAVPSFAIIQHEHHVFALQTEGCWYEQEATFHQIEGDISLPQIFLGAVILGNNQAVALINHAEVVNQCLRSPNLDMPSSQANVSPNTPQLHSPKVDSLSSLSDFFWTGAPSQDTDISEFLEQPLRSVGSSSEPENLESSGVFMSDLDNGQKRRSHQPKVLIVESSANIRRYLAMTLAKSGFLTEQVQDGKEAIAFLKDRHNHNLGIDIVITDLEMPQMDGFKLLSGIRSDADLHNLPIVVLTARNNENDQKLALELGANAYFCKPYREQELIKTLQELVSK